MHAQEAVDSQPQKSQHQILCSHCEELVHRYAARCPYCQHNLSSPPPAPPPILLQLDPQPVQPPAPAASKILPLPVEKIVPTQQPQHDSTPAPVREMGKLLLPLLTLLGGSFFFLFAILLKLFAHDGELVLRWSASSWPYYAFPALGCIVAGLLSLSRLDPTQTE